MLLYSLMTNIMYQIVITILDWPETQCDLLVDPLSRGHKATFTYYGQPYLQYDGQKMMFDEESGDWCPSFEYYSGVSHIDLSHEKLYKMNKTTVKCYHRALY